MAKGYRTREDYLAAKRREYERFKVDPVKVRKALDRQCMRKFGMTIAARDELLAKQGGVCAVCCDRTVFRGKGGAHVDHDHSSGKVRGILCSRCNMGIGLFVDSPPRLEAAALYLKRAL